VATIVFVHAHPDDEALLTGGTMARLAADGHRVVLVTATDGAAGLAARAAIAGPGGAGLAAVRSAELRQAAALLGCARVVTLGYADSGSSGPLEPGCFAAIAPDEPARRLAALLADERADLVVGYDPAGGYGHRDHEQVHRVVRLAAGSAGTSRLLEATVDRRALQRALRVVAPLTRRMPDFRAERFASAYTATAEITHCVDVRRQLAAKRAAMLAHLTQQTSDAGMRSIQWFLRLPAPLFRLCFGREWFVEVGAEVPSPWLGDLLQPA